MRIKKPGYVAPIISGAHATVTNQSIPTATDTKFNWDTKWWDYNEEMDIVTNNKFTVKQAGLYIVCLRGLGTALGDNVMARTWILRNGSDSEALEAGQIGSATDNCSQELTWIGRLDIGDYIEGFYKHYAGANKNVNGQITIALFYPTY
jgi:hypothetical protein